MKKILLALICLQSPALFGQPEVSHRCLTLADGLASNTIYDLYQAQDGSVIIGHEKGLSRYNGIEISHYTQIGKATPLTNIQETEPGIFISSNFWGEVFITRNNTNVLHRAISDITSGFSEFFRYGNKIIQKDSKTIRILWDNGILSGKTLYTSPTHIYDTEIVGDTMYMDVANAVVALSLRSYETDSVGTDLSPAKYFFAKDGLPFLYKTVNGTLEQISRFRKSASVPLQNYMPNTKGTVAYVLKNGNLVLGTFNGLYVYDKDFGFLGRFLTDVQVGCIMEDVEGNLWVGTLQDGVVIIPSFDILSWTGRTLFSNAGKISKTLVLSDTLLAVASYDGQLTFIDTNGLKRAQINLGNISETQAMHFNHKNNLLTLYCQKIIQIDLRTFKIVDTIAIGSTKAIYSEGDTLFLGRSRGFQVSLKDKVLRSGHNELWISRIVPYKGCFLMETQSGIMLIDKKTLALKEVEFQGLNGYMPANLCKSDTSIYFAAGNSVYRLFDDQRIFDVSEKNISYLMVRNGSFYAVAGRKIYIYENGRLDSITSSRGLQIKEVIGLEYLCNSLVAVGNSEIQWFRKRLPPNLYKPTVHYTLGKGTFRAVKNTIISDYRENRLVLNFEILPNISGNGQNILQYRIKGLNETWRKLDPGATLTLERLPFGNYTLEAIAFNEDGLPSEKVQINLKVNRPYWATWWFIGVVILGIIAIMLLFLLWRLRKIRKKNEIRLEKERLEIQALSAKLLAARAQMNPHFIFNSLSSIQSKILNDKSVEAYDNLSTFSKLLRQSLEFTSREFIKLNEELSFQEKYIQLEQLRTDCEFRYKILIDKDINTENYTIPSMMLQPFIENAILHGLRQSSADKQLTVHVSNAEDNSYSIRISDNGIGRKAAQNLSQAGEKKHSSYATEAILTRIDMLRRTGKRDISLVISDLHPGTRVSITIKPVN